VDSVAKPIGAPHYGWPRDGALSPDLSGFDGCGRERLAGVSQKAEGYRQLSPDRAFKTRSRGTVACAATALLDWLLKKCEIQGSANVTRHCRQ
jgi:hypothetical protein